MLVNKAKLKKNISELINRDAKILIICFSLIVTEYYFFELNRLVFISFEYVFYNSILLFFFSIFFFSSIIKILNFNFFKNNIFLSNFIFIILLSFIFFKIFQIPSLYGNFLTIKGLTQNILAILFSDKFIFFLQFLKIIIPFFLIATLLFKLVEFNKKIILNFIVSFSSIFLIIMSFEVVKKRDLFETANINTINQASNKKVIWFVFDELDPSYLKNQKMHGLKLTNLENLSNKSIYGENIYSAANFTLYSMLSVLTNNELRKVNVVNNQIEITNKENETKYFNYKNSLFNKLNENNLSFNILSDAMEYCNILKLKSNCEKRYNKFKNYFDSIPKTYLPLQYIIKINNKINFRQDFNLEKLNSFNSSASKKLFVTKEGNRDIFDFKNLLDKNYNLDFFHIYLPHVHPSLNLNVLPVYAKKYFNMNPANYTQEYLLNLKYLDLLVGEIFKQIDENKNQQILTIISSDHWRRSDSPKKAKPSFFLAKIKNDDEYINISETYNNIFIYDLIINYLTNNITTHKEIKNFIDDVPSFNKENVYFYNIDSEYLN